jgi:phosphatidylinositol alpha-1,6-mannosyltransferase
MLALLPSQGLGGGIEAYASAVLEAATSSGADVSTLTLAHGPGGRAAQLTARVLFTVEVLRAARALRAEDVQVVCFLPGLLPVGLLAHRVLRAGRRRLKVIAYGVDIWSASTWRRALWKCASVEFVTVSAFSAGALLGVSETAILPPGIGAQRYERLLERHRDEVRRPGSLQVLSVFRLADLEAKGGRVLIEAVERLRHAGRDLSLTIAGQRTDHDDEALTRRCDWLNVVRSPTDDQLAKLYEQADVFVLASRVRTPPEACGEGFGIVLVEAALAGLPVIAPASGGSHAAFVAGLTGLAPATQSVESLGKVLEWAVTHPGELLEMGRNGREWASQAFAPDRYRMAVEQVLLGAPEQPSGFMNLRLKPVKQK